ncbi:MAG: DegT/DnrJ/EryC1/StrS family aminotransferase [Planctomycetia bacterium]|nr:DegT/DnrJ/EryC1/StrS family aminotransferase [Planctomycetia bacterium]
MSVAPSRHALASTTIPLVATPSAGVPLLDVQRQYQTIRREIAQAIERVCDSGRFVLGPDCDQLEQSLARYCQVPHAIACASGSDALLLALMAHNIGPGDEVLMPSYTFFATASAAWRLGAKPVFVDIDPITFNIAPNLLEGLITAATKAIIPVHLYGQCAEMRSILAIARRHRIPVIEDAAQAVGAEYDGRRAGSWGTIGCLSFYPTKNLGGFGDGGLLTTTDAQLADKLRLLGTHGMRPRYFHHVVGINSRLDTLQAAVLNVKLPYLEGWTAGRQANAQRYTELFALCGMDRVVMLPRIAPLCRHVWNQYVIRVPDGRRDALRAYLAERNIGTEIYYPVPLHLQECFAKLGYTRGNLPESERAGGETLALPIFPELTAAEQQTVVREIAAFFHQSGRNS